MSDNAHKTLGELIRDGRVKAMKGLSERARELDLTPSSLCGIENDRRVPAVVVLQRLSDLLGLDFNEVMALAGRVGEQAEQYLKGNTLAWSLFRRISESKLNDEELKLLQKMAEKLKDKRKGEGS